MKNKIKQSFILYLLLVGLSIDSYAGVEEGFNVALSKWGTTVKASSYRDYPPELAIDGKWISNKAGVGRKFLWNSEPITEGDHWLMLNFNKKRDIYKIVIRHEGIYEKNHSYNTSDFRLQYSESENGPWENLISPIKNNSEDVTVHLFSPTNTRYVRLWIDKGEANSNSWARIHEIEAYAKLSSDEVLVASCLHPNEIRQGKDEEEVKLTVDLFPQKIVETFKSFNFKNNLININIDKKQLKIKLAENGYSLVLWLPVSALNNTIEFSALSKDRTIVLHQFPILSSMLNRWDYMADGQINIVCSSHQDIAWADDPYTTADNRTTKCILPALKRMKDRVDAYFSMENVLYLDEYLECHPTGNDKLFQLTKNGNLDWGATYNQPYESLLSSEQLVREVYLGAKKVRKLVPGTSARVAYSVDVPGRSLQMPQILAKADVPYFLFSRHERSLFNWMSPDGSKILCWAMGHYYDLHHLGGISETNEFISTINDRVHKWKSNYEKQELPAENGALYSADYIGPADFDSYIEQANAYRKSMKENGVKENSPYLIPKLGYTSSEQFFDKIANSGAPIETIMGERPNLWLYIHGPTHHKAITSKREAGVLLPAVENFATINSVLDGSFDAYPQERLNTAWAASIYDDHGWGGNNGHITDQVFKDKLDFAKSEGEKMLNNELLKLTDKICTDNQKGEAIVLFNALSWKRTDPVEVKVKSLNKKIGIVDYLGNKVECQILETGENNEYLVTFIANDIPSLGYKTYFITKSAKENDNLKNLKIENSIYENEYYSLGFTKGGLSKIYDKKIGQDIIRTDKFMGAEVFTMQSIGNGAHEFGDIQKPDMTDFDKMSLHNSEWKIVENGSVYAIYELNQALKNYTVKQQIKIYHHHKRIDFNVDLLGWDGTKSREFRLALPLNMKSSKVTYEVPMGTVTIGEDEVKGNVGYPSDCKDVHPREVQNFISTNNSDFGVTLSSSVSVFDHVDPTDNAVDYSIIQPILLASRKSCHGAGNWYLQEGDHNYSFSVFSHDAGWENGYKQAIQANNPIIAVNSKSKKGSLPSEKSFFSVEQPNVMVSAIKKCEDDSSVVVRMYDIKGVDTNLEFNTFFNIKSAEHTNIIEEKGKTISNKDNKIIYPLKKYSIETFKFNIEEN